MKINAKHPEYVSREGQWEICRDTYAGEKVIKWRSEKYLKPTPGMEFDGMGYNERGRISYRQYLERAVYHNYISGAVETIIGLLHSEPPNIQLPSQLEFMRENATPSSEPLSFLLRKINVEQLITGRLGLLLDMDEEPNRSVIPKISLYSAEKILNWEYDTKMNGYSFVVLDESGIKRNGFDWQEYEQYRLLTIEEKIGENSRNYGRYHQIVFSGEEFRDAGKEIYPVTRGASPEKIPFLIVNSNDINARTDDPPLFDLANMSLSIYRSEADYRQTLFLLSQDTLVVIGAEDNDLTGGRGRVGAGSALFLPPGSDAKYIGVNNAGMSEQRAALENDKVVANNKSIQLIDTRSAQRESGQALHIRAAAQTATLNQLASTAAGALEQMLKMAAEWVGANPEEVKVDPNTDFISEKLTGQDLLALLQAKSMGAPISSQSLHELMVERGLTSKDFEAELELMEEEAENDLLANPLNRSEGDGEDGDRERENGKRGNQG